MKGRGESRSEEETIKEVIEGEGGNIVPTVASAKTIIKLVSSTHLILKPPNMFSHSENAD